ncbi:MerR family transcriptional regulator [Streptomyces sp. NPDC048718]|uniref:MerR family transcriptional regulator n=1 Tax=Streptomyces sp. NPDC048718 TaxID=3365587 RepID=UPI003720F046
MTEEAARATAPPGLTTGAVARRLGVSPTTLRSWDRRYGLGPEARSAGRHRRWSPADVALVEHMCRLTAGGAPPAEAARVALAQSGNGGPGPAGSPVPVPPAAPLPPDPRSARNTLGAQDSSDSQTSRNLPSSPDSLNSSAPPASPHRRAPAAPVPPVPRRGAAGSGLPLGDVRLECRGLARAAVRLDSARVESGLLEAVGTHGLVGAWEEIMVPTLRAVGRKWASSADRYVEVEHLLSWHVSTALRSAPLLLPRAAVPAGAPPVVLACAPDEQHALPIEALYAALAERGVPCRMLGAAVPVEALLACVRRTGPAAVVLWSQARSTASAALARRLDGLRWGAAGARGRPLVLPAGPGWDRRGVRGFPRCAGLGDAVGLLHGLYAPDGTVRGGFRSG